LWKTFVLLTKQEVKESSIAFPESSLVDGKG
jgi:hypothetical protein